MNYLKHYKLLCQKRRKIPATGVVEKHHEIPKCVGGLDSKENLVALTPEEHYVAHLFLRRLYPESKGLWYALMQMGKWGRGSRLYGSLRRLDYEEKRIGRLNK